MFYARILCYWLIVLSNSLILEGSKKKEGSPQKRSEPLFTISYL